jgi:hypothetical protein
MNRRNLILSALACLLPTGAIAADSTNIAREIFLRNGYTVKSYETGNIYYPYQSVKYKYHKPTRSLIPVPHPRPLEDFEQ